MLRIARARSGAIETVSTFRGIRSRGGIESKVGEFPIEKIDEALIKEKFVALFKRLVAK